ncbi:MAG TPA: P1 family peptidase [Streptosporangiaceae bacterium]|jgi:D-aminopeptidase
MTRAADLGIRIGILPSGPTGSVVDVPGVGVGHATVWRDEPPPPEGRGIARTGVTVLDLGGNLFRSPVPAGGAVLNGAGECTGFLAAAEWGLAETPVFLTSTMQVGRVYDAACELLMAEDPGIGADDVIIPIVAECDDSFLSDARRMQVDAGDVLEALEAARAGAGGPAPFEGAVGAGTGMSCLGYKGGIGTASRLARAGEAADAPQYTVGALVLANFGERDRLTIDGRPAGRLLAWPPPGEPGVVDGVAAERATGTDGPGTGGPGTGGTEGGEPAAGGAGAVPRSAPPAGSCIVVLVTDAPLDSAGCVRLARRAGLGLARTGSTASHGSGEIFLGLATGLRAPRGQVPAVAPVTGGDLNELFAAAVEATEEAVLNCLLAAPTVTGRDGNTSYGLPATGVAGLLREAGRS